MKMIYSARHVLLTLTTWHPRGKDLILNSNIAEVVEHACGMGSLQMGEYVSNVSHGIDTFSIREPLGVCAGICPFNFPTMIPLWVRLILLFVEHQVLFLLLCLLHSVINCTIQTPWFSQQEPVVLYYFRGLIFVSCQLLFFPNKLWREDLIIWVVSFVSWLQMFPIAVTCGNTFVLKPSEKDPGVYLYQHIVAQLIIYMCCWSTN
jgi:hypothetical protein